MLNITQIKNSHKFRALLMVLTVILCVLVGVKLVLNISQAEHDREWHQWQMIISRGADNRADAINQWVQQQFDELGALADNTSLRLYLTELEHNSSAKENHVPKPRKKKSAKQNGDPYQLVYLRNLLAFTAERSGFKDGPTLGEKLKANISDGGESGIALLNKQREPISHTVNMPAFDGEFADFIRKVTPGSRALSDIYLNKQHRPVIAFAIPVFAIQSDPRPENQLGMIVGVRTVDDSLFPLLNEPGSTDKTLETMLVSVDYGHNLLRYLSPLKDGTPALGKTSDASDKENASVFAIEHPGRFKEKRDYAYAKVLVTGRKLDIAPWFLIQKISRAEALHNSDKNAKMVLTIGFAIIAFLAALFFAVWRYGVSVRARHAADRYKKLYEDYAAQKELLSLLSDHKPEAFYVVDEEGKCRFANLEAAHQAGLESQKEIIGKTLATLIGKERALTYMQLGSTALVEGRITSHVQRIAVGKDEMIIQSRHIPLDTIPGVKKRGVLILEQDITTPMLEKERLANLLNSLVSTLISIMDTRDSFTANHSTRVSQLSRAIGAEMELDYASLDTVETAGMLMNLGKIFVPLNLLTKTGKLTKKDEQTIHSALQQTSDLLRSISFDGPVVETIHQAHELKHKRSTRTLTTSRIIYFANAFVSMLSPRAYRDRLSVDAALEVLAKDAKGDKDKSVLAALANYLENHGGRELWEQVAKKGRGKKE